MSNVPDYECYGLLGSGSFGKVYIAKKKKSPNSGHRVAIKIMDKKKATEGRKFRRHLLFELKILRIIRNCDYFTKIYDSFESEKEINFVMRYAPHGDFRRYFKDRKLSLSKGNLKVCIAEIAFALNYLHNLNIIHLDMKLNNILISEAGHIVLADFGMSRILKNEQDYEIGIKGSMKYLAPEIFRLQPYKYASDYWSLGIIIHIIATHEHPYSYLNIIDSKYEAIIDKEPCFNKRLDPNLKNLIEKFLMQDPEKRMGSDPKKFQEIQRHPYLEEMEWDKIKTGKGTPPFSKHLKKEFENLENKISVLKSSEVTYCLKDLKFTTYGPNRNG